ncbi:MAG: cytochrome c biogenesis protein CcdA, partial [Microbacterium sp.]|nr:cytochrome c biogenesis protein CcdA [Microbacterium sp.]
MNPEVIINSGALWLAIPVAMLAGLISFLSPCVLPLVPGYLGFLGGAVSPRSTPGTPTAVPGRGRLVLGVLLFILGFSVVFVAITALGGAANVFLIRWGDLITRILGGVIVFMGLVFLGLFGFAQREVRFHVDSKYGVIGAPLLGIA